MINYKVILRVLGHLLIIEGVFLLISFLVSLFYLDTDPDPASRELIISTAITLLTGGILGFTARNASVDFGKREGYIIVSIVWIVFSFFGSLPFYISGSIPTYTDAFFETMSGFTTTGASILNDIEAMPHGLLFWRSLTQWLGGMGIIVLSLAILPLLGIGGMQLFVAEVPGPTPDKLHPRVKETAKRLWAIYIIFTVSEVILLLLGGMSLFDAINHAFTTMATGGYSTKQASIAHWDSSYIHYVIVVFMFLAGTNFTLSYFAMHLKFKKVWQNEEFRYYVGFIAAFTVIITLGLYFIDNREAHYNVQNINEATVQIYENLEKLEGKITEEEYELLKKTYEQIEPSFSILSDDKITIPRRTLEQSFRDSLFQVVSIMTTTGYATSDYLSWISFLTVLIFVIMFFGGSAGSTGGGPKIVRLVLLLKNSYLEFKRLIHPNAVIPVRLNHHAVSPEIVTNVLAFFVFYILMFVIGTIAMSVLGLDLETSMGAVIACLGNIGPGIGDVGPVSNFYHLPALGKWILSFLMLVGRLELFTVIILLSKAFWKK